MRIISKFKDYYDSVQIHGQDPNCIYVRNKKEIEFSDKKIDKIDFDIKKQIDFLETILLPCYKRNGMGSFRVGSEYFLEDNCFILFCGKIYYYMHFIKWDGKKKKKFNSRFYDYESVKKFFEKHGNNRDYMRRYIFYKEMSNNPYFQSSLYYIKNFFEKSFFSEDKIYNLHQYFNSPIILVNDKKIVLNPELKKYFFFRKKDSFSTFQELSMYISGVLGNPNPDIVELDDKMRKAKHGYDKWSFRKEPTKKRKK